MRTIRLYLPEPFAIGAETPLSKAAAHHAITVLRGKNNQPVVLFNGEGGEYHGTLTVLSKRSASVNLTQFIPDNRTTSIPITLGIGISKGDRMDWALQKATELGATNIVPLITQRVDVKLNNERLQKKVTHWQQIIISACEQSGLNKLPILSQPTVFSEWIESESSSLKLVMDPTSKQEKLPEKKPNSIALLVGPEGGLEAQEITQANACGFNSWKLGERILRTETAPIAGMAIFNYLWN